MKKIFFAIVICFAYLIPIHAKTNDDFKNFVTSIRQEAREKGISEKTIATYLTKLKAPRHAAIYDLGHQAQKTATFEHYLQAFIPHKSIVKGRFYMRKHHRLLNQVQKKYNVQPRFIVALWGFETYYGKHTGHAPIVETLVTLSYQHHRSKFYKAQLFSALKMLDRKHVIPQQKISTWDGGMGQTSFEPEIYLKDAVDFDNSGFSDIWNSEADVFASIANYLHKRGWDGQQTWGVEIKLPKTITKEMTGVKNKKSIAEWNKLGVRTLNGKLIKEIDSPAAIILTGGMKGRAFLVFKNFDVLLKWNNTTFEGVGVGILSDAIKQ